MFTVALNATNLFPSEWTKKKDKENTNGWMNVWTTKTAWWDQDIFKRNEIDQIFEWTFNWEINRWHLRWLMWNLKKCVAPIYKKTNKPTNVIYSVGSMWNRSCWTFYNRTNEVNSSTSSFNWLQLKWRQTSTKF